VGRRYAKFLKAYGIDTAKKLMNADTGFIKKKMGINGTRTQEELRGVSCYPMDYNVKPKQGTTVSRTFGRPVEKYADLRLAVAGFAGIASEKLRKEKLAAGVLTVYIMTSRFKTDDFYYNTETFRFQSPENNAVEIIKAATRCLETIFRKNYKYKKAGVLLGGLVPESHVQYALFSDIDTKKRGRKLMTSMDYVNNKMGRSTLKLASEGIFAKKGNTLPEWVTTFNYRSPAYTTRWDQLPLVR
jgi:DNA polymerase V